MYRFVFLLAVIGCTKPDPTSLSLTIARESRWQLDGFEIAVDGRQVVASTPEATLLLPDGSSGRELDLDVWGLRHGFRYVHGHVVVTPRLGHDTPVTIALGQPDVLGYYTGCKLDLFEAGAAAEDFSSQQAVEASWFLDHELPTAINDTLVFGPPNATNVYGAATSMSEPGDVLLCAQIRTTARPTSDADANQLLLILRTDPSDPTFVRSGMRLAIIPNLSLVQLQHQTADSVLTVFDSQPFAMVPDQPAVLDVLYYTHGSRFVAQIENVVTRARVQLRASLISAGLRVTQLGWKDFDPLTIERLVLAQPAVDVAPDLDAMLP